MSLKSPGEAAIQDAIVAALCEYCFKTGMRFMHSLPYANQQGPKHDRVAADLVALIDKSSMFMLEVKAFDHKGKTLQLVGAHEPEQLQQNLDISALGVPLWYAFDKETEIAQLKPGEFDTERCVSTLKQIGVAAPADILTTGALNFEHVQCLFDLLPPKGQAESISASIAIELLTRDEAHLGSLKNSHLALLYLPNVKGLTVFSQRHIQLIAEIRKEHSNNNDTLHKDANETNLANYFIAVHRASLAKKEIEANKKNGNSSKKKMP